MRALFIGMAAFALLLLGAGCQGEQKPREEPKSLSEDPRLSPWDLPLTDRPELVSDAIRPIFQDASGALWFGTPGGVSRYNPATDTWTPYAVKDGLAGNYVYAILQDKGGALWVGTERGVSRYDPETRTFSTRTTGDGLAEDHVLTIAEDAGLALWFGTYKGASRYDPKTHAFRTYTTKNGLAGDLVRAIKRDSSATLWFGTDGGVSRYDPKTDSFRTYTPDDGLVAKNVVTIAEEQGGALWFGTNEGASRFHPQTGSWSTYTTYSTKGGLVSNNIQTIAVDAGLSLWFGTSGGVSRYDPKTGAWSSYSTKDGLLGNDVQSIVWDSGGIGWFGGTGGGVSRFDPKTRAWKTHQIEEGRPRDNVQAIARGADGALWLGVENRGVLRYDHVTYAWSRYTAADGLADNNVRAIAAGTDGALWFGTNRGASRYDPKARSWRTFTTKDGLAGNEIRAIAAAADGALWFATNRGLGRYDPKTSAWSTDATKAGLSGDDVLSIAEVDGALWFGTNHGVSRYNKTGERRTYTTKNGLAADEVLSIAPGRHGDVWVGTSRGASRYDPKTDAWTTYEAGISQVMQAIVSDAGTLWFGTSAGVVRLALENDAGEAGALLPTISARPTFRAAALGDALVITRPGGGLSFIYTGNRGPSAQTSLPVYPVGTELTALAPGPYGGVWVGTDFGGLLLRKPGNEGLHKRGEDIQLTPRNGLPSATITALAPIAASNNERVWVGTSAGACLVSAGDKQLHVERAVRFQDGVPTGPVDALAGARDGSAFLAYNAIPRNRFSDPLLFDRRARTRLFRVRAEGAPKEIRTDEAFAKSEVRALALSPRHGLWVGTSAGLYRAKGDAALDAGVYNDGNIVLDPVTAEGELSAVSIRRLAIAVADDGSETVWMGVDRHEDTPPEIIGYRPSTSSVYKLSQGTGVPAGDAIDDMILTEEGDLVVVVGPTIARGRVRVPFLRPAAAPPPPVWGLLAIAALSILVAAGASAAVVMRRSLYLRTPFLDLPFSALTGTIRSMQMLRVLDASWDRLGLPKSRIALLKVLTSSRSQNAAKLRALAELLGMNNAATAYVDTLPHGLTILSTKLPDPAPFREHPISLVAIDTTEARKSLPVHVRETLEAGLEKAGQRFELPYLLLAGGNLAGDILPADLGSLRLGERELKTLLFAKDPGHTLAGLLHARRLLALSPYEPYGEVKDEHMFFGRVALLKEILLSPSIQQLIIGPRRVGKTSLLKRLVREITVRRPNAEPIFVDLYGIREHSRAVRALARTLKVTVPPDADPDTAFVEILRARFQDSGKKGVVLIDEADGLIEADAAKGFPLLSAMRSLQAEEVCSFVLAGYLYLYRETLNQGSPLYNFATKRVLGPLDPEAVRDLARVPMERLGVAYADPDLPARIAVQTGGYPSFVQLLCHEELKVLQESEEGGLLLTEKHVEQAEARVGRQLSQIFGVNAGKEAQIIVCSLLGREEFSTADAEQALERALGHEVKCGVVERALQELRLFGFCVEEEGRITWAIPLLRRTLLAAEPEVAVKRLVEELSQS